MVIFKKIGLPIISVLGIIGALYALAFALNSEIVAPSPNLIFKEFVALFKTKNFIKSAFLTLWRSTYSFLIAFLVALIFAVLANKSEIVERLFYPVTVIFRAMPTMAIILLCLIWLKASKSPSAISFIVVFPMLYSAILSSLRAQDKKLLEMAKVYGVSGATVLFKLVFPQVLSALVPQLISTFSFNIKLVIAGEAMAYTKLSIGVMMSSASSAFETARLLALATVAIILSFLVEFLLKGLCKIIKEVAYGYNRKKAEQIVRG